MTPLVFNLGPTELLIILAIVLLLFGGARLAGLGKSTGRAIKEFKEETRGISDREAAEKSEPVPPASSATSYQQPPPTTVDDTSTSEPRRDI
jgi:sec-independent protein translocase protein TatA